MKQRLCTLRGTVLTLAFLFFFLSFPAAAKIKGNSDYGINDNVAFRVTRGAASLVDTTQSNTLKLDPDPVWCAGSGQVPGDCDFDYLIDLTLPTGSQLISLTFNPGNMRLTDFGIVVFDIYSPTADPTNLQCGPTPPGSCPVKSFSDPSYKGFQAVANGISFLNNTASFTNFNASTLAGSGPIVLYVTASGTPGTLSVTPHFTSVTPPPAPGPLASSYKSIINIRNLFPGNKTCPADWVAVGDSGDGNDSFGTTLTLTEQFCANPKTGQFSGDFTIAHSSSDAFFGVFNGTFVPSGKILEVHATWRITGGQGQFSGMRGAGTGKGTASVVNGAPGPGTVLLDGSVATTEGHESR
jgi:hypothetical protein